MVFKRKISVRDSHLAMEKSHFQNWIIWIDCSRNINLDVWTMRISYCLNLMAPLTACEGGGGLRGGGGNFVKKSWSQSIPNCLKRTEIMLSKIRYFDEKNFFLLSPCQVCRPLRIMGAGGGGPILKMVTVINIHFSDARNNLY